MPKLKAKDIFVGMIAFFTPENLNHETGIEKPTSTDKDKPKDGRPFVCYDVDNDMCLFVQLTTKQRAERLEITQHIKGGVGRLAVDKQYLNSGSTTYKGNLEAFARASHYQSVIGTTVPEVTEIGLKAIREYVVKERGHRPTGNLAQRTSGPEKPIESTWFKISPKRKAD